MRLKTKIYIKETLKKSYKIRSLIKQTHAKIKIVWWYLLTVNDLHSKIPQTIKMMLISMDTDNPMAGMMELDILWISNTVSVKKQNLYIVPSYCSIQNTKLEC